MSVTRIPFTGPITSSVLMILKTFDSATKPAENPVSVLKIQPLPVFAHSDPDNQTAKGLQGILCRVPGRVRNECWPRPVPTPHPEKSCLLPGWQLPDPKPDALIMGTGCSGLVPVGGRGSFGDFLPGHNRSGNPEAFVDSQPRSILAHHFKRELLPFRPFVNDGVCQGQVRNAGWPPL